MTQKQLNVGVVGGTGYTGSELLRLLAGHSGARVTVITSRSEEGIPVAEMFPNLRGYVDLAFSHPDPELLRDCDVVFFATPNGTAMGMVRPLLEHGVRVVDLAADFRLRSAEQWQQWYGIPHACPELLEEAVYGLPEIHRSRIQRARLVANPGCYPTAVQLGFLPLLEQGLVDEKSLIADAKSGVSGAGRKANVNMLLCEASESFKAYGVAGHRHLPEIVQGLNEVSSEPVALTFVPHLTPMIRGIHATLYARLVDPEVDVQSIYEQRFETDAFVDVMPEGNHPETRSVRGSNLCRLAVHRPQGGDVVVILSVIDNLVKGAAGQAIQNMNVMFGLPENSGLLHIPSLP